MDPSVPQIDRRSLLHAVAAFAAAASLAGCRDVPAGSGTGASRAAGGAGGREPAGGRSDRGSGGAGRESDGETMGQPDRKQPSTNGQANQGESQPGSVDRGSDGTDGDSAGSGSSSTADDHQSGGQRDAASRNDDGDLGSDRDDSGNAGSPSNDGDAHGGDAHGGGGGGGGGADGDGDVEPTPGGGDPGQPPLISASLVPVGGGAILARERLVVTQPTAGQFRCFGTRCPHRGCGVDAVRDGLIACPCHGSLFDLTTGAPVAGPAPRALDAVAVKVREGAVYLA